MVNQPAIFKDVQSGKTYIAVDIIEESSFMPPVRRVATLSTSLEVGTHKSGESGLWPIEQFQQRFTKVT